MMTRLTNGRVGWRVVAWTAMAATVSIAMAGPRYNVAGVVRISEDAAGNVVVEGTLGEVRNSSNDAHRLSCQQSRSETTSSTGAVTRSTVVICSARNTE